MQSIADIVRGKKYNISREEIGVKPTDSNPNESIKLKALVDEQSDDIVGVISGGNVDIEKGNLRSFEYEVKRHDRAIHTTHTVMDVDAGYILGNRYVIELHVYENSNDIVRAWYIGYMNNLNIGYTRSLVGKWCENKDDQHNVKSEDIL